MKQICVAAGMLLCLFSPAPAATEATAAPERFRARIGGFLGYTYEVVLKDDYIDYTRSTGGKKTLSARVHPTMEQWKAFRTELDAIGVWQWRAQYSAPGVADGTQWSLEVAYPDRSIKTQGSNEYPGARSGPSGGPESSKIFARYLKAVQRLLGGKSFE
jgi:hypothetical protein